MMYYTGQARRKAPASVAVLFVLNLLPLLSQGFQPSHPHIMRVQRHNEFDTSLAAKSINKQAELRRKMNEAKKQKIQKNLGNNKDDDILTDQEIRERNDRLRFEELLKRESANVLNDYSADGYLTKQQEQDEIMAATSGVDRFFEGDPAPEECFEELVGIVSENAIGKKGAERLVPWLGKGSNDYLLVITDPRPKSYELQETVDNIQAELPADIRSRLVIINADSPAENRRWLKKKKVMGDPGDDDGTNNALFQVYSDEKLEWMRTYTALGEKRWSMTMFLLARGRICKLVREMDQYGASKAIRNAVKSFQEESRPVT